MTDLIEKWIVEPLRQMAQSFGFVENIPERLWFGLVNFFRYAAALFREGR